MVGLKSYLVGLVPFVAMVMLETFDVGLSTLSKAAMSEGMSNYVFVVYSNALATLIVLPSSFLFERTTRPPLTFFVLCNFFLLSFVGITVMQNCVFLGVNYSSPILGSAMSNVIPAFTFLLAVIFRMEKVNLRSLTSQLKIMGTLVSISGALIVTFYAGPAIWSLLVQSPSISSEDSLPSQSSLFNMVATASNWILGGLFLAVACLSQAIRNVFQAAILKGYPSQLTMVGFYCLFGTIQCTAITLFAERNNPDAWKLSLDIELISVIYSAVLGCVFTYYVQTWCIHKKGPVFVAMFKPLSIAIAAFFSVIFLGEALYVGRVKTWCVHDKGPVLVAMFKPLSIAIAALFSVILRGGTLFVGSVIGSIVIAVGFYGVIWAQSKEEEKESYGVDRLPSSLDTTPLLQTHTVD